MQERAAGSSELDGALCCPDICEIRAAPESASKLGGKRSLGLGWAAGRGDGGVAKAHQEAQAKMKGAIQQRSPRFMAQCKGQLRGDHGERGSGHQSIERPLRAAHEDGQPRFEGSWGVLGVQMVPQDDWGNGSRLLQRSGNLPPACWQPSWDAGLLPL